MCWTGLDSLVSFLSDQVYKWHDFGFKSYRTLLFLNYLVIYWHP